MTSSAAPEMLDVCVVAHTHWDREWYHTAPRFRQRLVALIDALLKYPPDPDRPFLLDGQAVVLEDYLTVRPQKLDQLQQHLAAHALEAGPWYVLADGLIPSGEAIVRNLIAGRRALRRLNATPPGVLYCPDTFGHPAALPAVAQGFGFALAIVWRGLGGATWPGVDVLNWRANGDHNVLVYHLPPDGYEVGSALPHDPEASVARWSILDALLRSRSNVGVALLPSGADHHARQPNLDAAIAALQMAAADAGPPTRIARTSLSEFARRVTSAANQHTGRVPEIRGELRNSYGYTWTLGGTLATRAAQKRQNARTERALLRDVEPWLALAWFHRNEGAKAVADDGSITLAQLPVLLDVAWRTLLRAHPHDTLCGCSIDAVARAMNGRLASALSQAVGLRLAGLSIALQHDTVASRDGSVSASPTLVIRNRAPRWRGGIAELSLDETICDEPVGPSSTNAAPKAIDATVPTPFIHGVRLQTVRTKVVRRRRESPQHYPDNDVVASHRAIAWVSPVPPLGLACHAVSFRSHPAPVSNAGPGVPPSVVAPRSGRRPQQIAPGQPESETPLLFHPVSLQEHDAFMELRNDRLLVRIEIAGVTIVREGRTIHHAVSFDSTRDAGDSYTPSIRGAPRQLVLRKFRAGLHGPMRASVETFWSLGNRRSRITVMATCILDAATDILRVDVQGENRRHNHRLRMNFATDVAAVNGEVAVWADAAFGPVRRTPISASATSQTGERVLTTMPMHRWVTISNSDRAATAHSDGLAEVEVQDDGTVALTLLRAIGELSRNDLPERPGHAGWPAAIPLAQSQGRFRARTALHLHDAWSPNTRDEIEMASDSLLLPLVGNTWRDLKYEAPFICGPELRGQGLRWSTVSLADNTDAIVLRCTSDSNVAQPGTWILPDGAWEFARSRLDETLLDNWHACSNRIEFSVPPLQALTLCVRRRVR